MNEYLDHTKPLPKEITDEIRFILEGIRDGRLKHNQKRYHCGTAHCVAGWCEALDYAAQIGQPAIVNEDLGYQWFDVDLDSGSEPLDQGLVNFSSDRLALLREELGYTGDLYGYAELKWRLTNAEATTLFKSEATLDEQFALLERLEAGERLGMFHDDDFTN